MRSTAPERLSTDASINYLLAAAPMLQAGVTVGIVWLGRAWICPNHATQRNRLDHPIAFDGPHFADGLDALSQTNRG